MRDLVEKERALFESAAWTGSLRDLSAGAKFRSFLLCRKLEAAAKERKEQLRDALMAEVAERGTQDEKGSQVLPFDEGVAIRTRRVASAPDVARVRELLASRGLGETNAIVTKVVKTEAVDSSVLDALVERGELTAAEVEACYAETWAFNATENKNAKAALAEIL
jgi:hypothetical protein